MAKRNTNPIPHWMGREGEPFLRIPNSLMDSRAWKALTARQSRLYIAMARHYKGQGIGEVGKKYSENPEWKRNDLFFFPWAEAYTLGIYGKSVTNKKPFYADVKVLISHGFIRKEARGHNMQMTIYQFSDGWKKWVPPQKQNAGSG